MAPDGGSDIVSALHEPGSTGKARQIPGQKAAYSDATWRDQKPGQFHHLPELAASDHAVPLSHTLPTPAPVACGIPKLDGKALHALEIASQDGLTLQRNQSTTGVCGITFNGNKGRGAAKPKPYQVRLRAAGKRVARGCFDTAEEAALHRAKLLKYEAHR